MTQIITNTNGGGGSGGGGGDGDMKKSVYDPNNIQADAFDYNNFENTPDLSGYQTTGNLVTDLSNADNTHYPSAKAVADAISSSGGGDMLKSVYDPDNVNANAFDYNNFTNTPDLSDYVDGPASSTDGDVVLFDGATGKIIKDSGEKLSDFQVKWIEVNVATAYGTAAKVGTTTAGDYTPTKGDFLLVNFVNGCSVNNPTLNIDGSGAKAIRTGNANATTSTFGLGNTASSNIKALLYYDGTYYRCWSTTNSNTTYSAMSVSEGQTGTATSSRSMRADYLKQIIKYHAVSDATYDSTWDGKTDIAPSKNAVYDKINSIDAVISSAATSSNQLVDKNYVDDSINSVTAYYITKNAQGDQWSTRAELFAATTFYSGGVVRVPTKNDYTIVLSDEQHDNATTRYIYNSGWEYQYTVNETAMTQAQLDAINSGITSAKVSTYDGYASTIAGKQATLVSGTNIKTVNSTSLLGSGDVAVQPTLVSGTNIKTVNSTSLLGSGDIAVQPTLVSGTNIKTINSNSLLGSGNLTINDVKISSSTPASPIEGMVWYDTTNDVLKTYNGTSWDEAGGGGDVRVFAVPSVNDDISDMVARLSAGKGVILHEMVSGTDVFYKVDYHDDVTQEITASLLDSYNGGYARFYTIVYNYSTKKVTTKTPSLTYFFAPETAGTQGQVLTKTNSGYEWANASGGFELAPNSPLTPKYRRYGSQAQYDALTQYYTDESGDTVYFTI